MNTMNNSKKKDESSKFVYGNALKTKGTSVLINKIKFVDIYVNRPLASLVVRMVYKTRVTPNGLTYFSSVVGLLGAFFFTRGTYLYFVLGGIMAQLCSIIDGADGMLARSKNMCSSYGSYLDLFFDRIVDFSLMVCIAIGAFKYYGNPDLLFLGVFASGLYLLQINLFYLTKSFLNVKNTGDTGEARAILIWVMLLLSVANRLDIAVYALLAETVIVNLVRLFYFISLGKKN
jgi:phosphatidylglycerophosphate synthase